MTPKEKLLQEIEKTENQLKSLKEQLENCKDFPKIENALPGNVLEDGSVVIFNRDPVAVVMAPKETEYLGNIQEDRIGREVRRCLIDKGFIPAQWFIPSVKQLRYAMVVAPDQFDEGTYWSSDICLTNPCCGMGVSFDKKATCPGMGYPFLMELALKIRAFSCIFY